MGNDLHNIKKTIFDLVGIGNIQMTHMMTSKYVIKKFWYIFLIHLLILYFISHFWLGSEEQLLKKIKYPDILSFFLARALFCLIISLFLIVKLLIITRIFLGVKEIVYYKLFLKFLLIYMSISLIFISTFILFLNYT